MPATDTGQNIAISGETVSSATAAKLKYAAKTSLSLSLAYLIPMGMGWPQAQTAAITVMLIAATGLASESLQKGVMRVVGTVAGAVIGLALIAIFPQDRMAYLLAASITVSVLAYLYNAYQGDSTLFMLAAVVTLMVFNGGDAEGAFLYGVDRAFMTAFGVIIYTLVASTLWPVRAVDNTRSLAAGVAAGYQRFFGLLVDPPVEGFDNTKEQLASLLAAEEALQIHFAAVKRSADRVAAYLAEWNCIVGCYEELQSILLPALNQESRAGVQFERHIENYPLIVERIGSMFQTITGNWQEQAAAGTLQPGLPVIYRSNSLQGEKHLTAAAVASRAELLVKVQAILQELCAAQESLLFDRGGFVAGRKPLARPAFIWLDLENAKTAVRMFLTFWLATGIWITIHPPGGFTFVALCAVLVLLVSYTPVTPKLLVILLTLGFAFALPAYIFLLPQLSHWLQLGTFMFCYGFFGFYVFQGPVSIFFMLGLFALGIQNTMDYHFDAIALVVLTFYLLCTLLIVTVYFPFTSKPERLYASLSRRFFRNCARALQRSADYRQGARSGNMYNGSSLLAKLHSWGPRVSPGALPVNSGGTIDLLNQACDLLHGQIQVLAIRKQEFAGNRLVVKARSVGEPNLLVELCDTLAELVHNGFTQTGDRVDTTFAHIETRLVAVQERLDALRQDHMNEQYTRQELAQFFVYLNLQASTLDSLRSCHEACQAIDWRRLAGHRF